MILTRTPAHTGNKIGLDVFCNNHFNDWFYAPSPSVINDWQVADIDVLRAAYDAYDTYDKQPLPSLDDWILDNNIDTRYGNTIHIVSITPANSIVLSGNAIELVIVGTPNAEEELYINNDLQSITLDADGRLVVLLTVVDSGIVYITDNYNHVAKVEVV